MELIVHELRGSQIFEERPVRRERVGVGVGEERRGGRGERVRERGRVGRVVRRGRPVELHGHRIGRLIIQRVVVDRRHFGGMRTVVMVVVMVVVMLLLLL